jgi:hypothetical protein
MVRKCFCSLHRCSSERMSSDGKDGKAVMQQTAQDVDEVKRSSMLVFTVICSRDSNVLVGKQLQQDLWKWLSPPDPSTNHNIARGSHHKGTATWFFRSSIFENWKSAPSLLWMHGKRKLFFPLYPCASYGFLSFSWLRKEHYVVRCFSSHYYVR